MSREIIRFCKNGFVSKTDGVCFGVFISPDGNQITKHSRLQNGFPLYNANCSTSKANNMAEQLGGTTEPTSRNGWELVYLPNMSANHPSEFILRDRFYGGKYWRAYETTEHGWKATQIGNEQQMLSYVGELPEIYTPEEVEEATRETAPELSFLNNNRTELTAAAIVVALVLIIVIVKQ